MTKPSCRLCMFEQEAVGTGFETEGQRASADRRPAQLAVEEGWEGGICILRQKLGRRTACPNRGCSAQTFLKLQLLDNSMFFRRPLQSRMSDSVISPADPCPLSGMNSTERNKEQRSGPERRLAQLSWGRKLGGGGGSMTCNGMKAIKGKPHRFVQQVQLQCELLSTSAYGIQHQNSIISHHSDDPNIRAGGGVLVTHARFSSCPNRHQTHPLTAASCSNIPRQHSGSISSDVTKVTVQFAGHSHIFL